MRRWITPPDTRPAGQVLSIALLVLVALLGAACGGGDDSADGGETADGDVTPDAELEPVAGGEVVYGLESDTNGAWAPHTVICAVSCQTLMKSVYDPLAIHLADGEVVGFLLESIEPNDDATEWTLTMREGIEFHDGTPVDGAAIKDNLDRQREGARRAAALSGVVSVEADGLTATVTLTEPDFSFSMLVAGGPASYIASPTWLAAVDDGSADATEPVGTGPFVFDSYTPGESFRATANEEYWRDGLPLLDAIEFRFLAETGTRSTALRAGDIDVAHFSNAGTVADLREDDAVTVLESTEQAESLFVMLNPNGANEALADADVRRALGQAIDLDLFIEATGAGIVEPANGPYPPDSPGHLEDTGYPAFDRDAAAEAIESYEADNGDISISFLTTTDDAALTSVELLADQWEQVGVDVQIDQVEQAVYVPSIFTNDFEAVLFRSYGGFSGLANRIFWHGDFALPPGEISQNAQRLDDDVLSESLDAVHATDDPEAIVEAAQAINRQFGEQAYSLWLNWVTWGIASTPEVHHVAGPVVLPDGTEAAPFGSGIAGSHQVAQMWIEQ